MLDSVDVWLLSRPSLINQRKQTILPTVMQRQQLADSLARYMNQLGLERRVKTRTLRTPERRSTTKRRYQRDGYSRQW